MSECDVIVDAIRELDQSSEHRPGVESIVTLVTGRHSHSRDEVRQLLATAEELGLTYWCRISRQYRLTNKAQWRQGVEL